MPGKARINYFDIKLNPGEFDYLDILRRGEVRALDDQHRGEKLVDPPAVEAAAKASRSTFRATR